MGKYKYYIEVAVRDAREAQEIYKDGKWSRQGIAMTSTNYYESNNEDSIVAFLDELENNSIEIYETSASLGQESLKYKVGNDNPIMPDSLKKGKKYIYVYNDGSNKTTKVTFKGTTFDGNYEFTDDRGSYFTLTHDETLDRVTENATDANVNGMGEVSLPNGDSIGSGDVPIPMKKKKKKKVRKFSEILNNDADESVEDIKIELTETQKQIIIDLLINPELVNESRLELLDEGIFGSILGGIGGLALGKSIGKLLANTLGIKEKSPLYNVLTSRLVGTAIGAALGKKLKF